MKESLLACVMVFGSMFSGCGGGGDDETNYWYTCSCTPQCEGYEDEAPTVAEHAGCGAATEDQALRFTKQANDKAGASFSALVQDGTVPECPTGWQMACTCEATDESC